MQQHLKRLKIEVRHYSTRNNESVKCPGFVVFESKSSSKPYVTEMFVRLIMWHRFLRGLLLSNIDYLQLLYQPKTPVSGIILLILQESQVMHIRELPESLLLFPLLS